MILFFSSPFILPFNRGRNLQELIDINDNFTDLSVGFYLKSTLLCDDLQEAVSLIADKKIMQTRRKVVFCARDGFVVERDGIIKIAGAAREVVPCGIVLRKRRGPDTPVDGPRKFTRV